MTEQAVRRLAGCTDRSHTIWIGHVCSSGVCVCGSSDSVVVALCVGNNSCTLPVCLYICLCVCV